MRHTALTDRLGPFIARGLVTRVPTRWQILQGSIEMLPWVVIPDGNDRQRYAGAPLGHPIVRTPFLVAYTLGGHFNVGSGLGASERALQKHLLAVYHYGQPVYDLQVVQTFPDGLERLRHAFVRVRDRATPLRRLERGFVGAIVPEWDRYCGAMLGHIDRAAAFDYDQAPAWARPEFWSLASFMNYCAETFPPKFGGERPVPLLRRLAGLFLRKIRGLPPPSNPS